MKKACFEIFDDLVDFFRIFYIIVYLSTITGILSLFWEAIGQNFTQSDFIAFILICPLGYYIASYYKYMRKSK